MITIAMAHVAPRVHLHPEEILLFVVVVIVLATGGARLVRAIARR